MRKRGTVTILVVISLIPLLIASLFTVDIARISYAKNMVSQGNDLVLNSQLTRFNQALKDTYGLFAANSDFDSESFKKEYAKILINVTNGQLSSQDAERLAQSVIDTPGAVEYTGESNSLGIEIQSVDIRKAENGDLNNTNILQDQILEHMKYRGPISIGYGFLGKLSTFKSIKAEKDAAQRKVEFEEKRNDVLEKIKDLYSGLKEFYEAQKAFKANQRDEIENAKKLFISDTLSEKIIRTADLTYKDTILSMREYAFDVKDKIFPLEISKTAQDKFDNAVKENKLNEVLENLASSFDSGHYDHGDCILTQKEIDANLLFVDANSSNNGFYTAFHNFYKRADYQCDKVKDFFAFLELYRRKHGGIEYTYEMGGENHTIPLTYFNEINKRVRIYVDGIENRFKEILMNYTKDSMDYFGTVKVYYDRVMSQKEGVLEKLDAVKNAVEDVDKARENWSDAAKGLAKGEVKDKTLQEIKTSLQEFNQKDFDELKKTIEDEVGNAESYDDTLKSIELVHEGTSLPKVKLYQPDQTSIDVALEILRNGYTKKNLFQFSGMNIEGDPLEDIKLTKLINQLKFYKFTERIATNFKDNSDKVDENAKKYEEKKNEVKEQMDKANKLVGNMFANDVISSVDPTDGISTDRKGAVSTLKSAFGSLDRIISGFGDLGSLGKDSMEAILLNEYSTEFFTDYLDTKEAGKCSLSRSFLLNGKPVDKELQSFGSEVEYILYGHGEKQANINQAKNEILLLRFGLNLIYSFTDSEITSVTTSMSAVAGPFAPLLKVALHIVISLAESYFDIYLMTEKCLPVSIYKTARTWMFKPSGGLQLLENEVKQWAEDAATGVVQGVFSAINDKAVDTVEELKNGVNKGIDDLIDDKSRTVINQVKSEVQDPIINIVHELGDYVDAEDAKKHIDSIFEETKTHIQNTEDEYKVEKMQLFSFLEAQVKPILYSAADEITVLKEKVDEKINSVFELVNTEIKELSNQLSDQITTRIATSMDALKNKITGELDKAEEKTLEYTKDTISKMFAEETTDKLKDSADGKLKDQGKGKGVGIELNYREYLKMFMLLRHMDKDNSRKSTLENISKLIESNIQEKDANFSFEKYGSIYKITTKIKLNTLLLGNNDALSRIFVKQGNEQYKINPVEFGKKLDMEISSILGY